MMVMMSDEDDCDDDNDRGNDNCNRPASFHCISSIPNLYMKYL